MIAAQHARKKELAASAADLTYVVPSLWLAERVRSSSVAAAKKVVCIPNTFDAALFRPKDRAAAKKAFGFDAERKVLLFGALGGTGNAYKGWPILCEALRSVPESLGGVDLVVFGCAASAEKTDLPLPVRFVGTIGDPGRMADLYNAADVYVLPSTAESFSNTTMESLACGTPVVAFGVGGVFELLADESSGHISCMDAAALAAGIVRVLTRDRVAPAEISSRVGRYCGRKKVVDAHRSMWKGHASEGGTP